jgi:hypothetical protein
MSRSDFADVTAPKLLDRRFNGDAPQPGFFAEKFWCSVMRNGEKDDVGKRASSSTATAPVCDQLKAMFGAVADEPMPDQLTLLADRLEAAFERGELSKGTAKRSLR